MVAFTGRPWEELHGSGGGTYSDLPNVQATWETNRGRATRFGIITDYASGDRGAARGTNQVQSQVTAFLTDFDTVLPGTKARAARSGGKVIGAPRALALEPLLARVVHLLSDRAVHLDCGRRGSGGRAAQVRR